MEIHTVLCPVDLTALSEIELDMACEVCEVFGARLVLLHNLAPPEVLLPQEALDRPEAEARLRDLASRVPRSIPLEGKVTRGPVGLIINQVARDLPADLMLLASHGWGDAEKESLTEALLADSPCPILAVQEGRSDRHPFHLRPPVGERRPRILVPTDFSDAANRAVDYAFELAWELPVEVHLLNVARTTNAAETARRKLEHWVPDEISDQLRCHVTVGDPAPEILAYSRDLDVDMVVMGEHARGVLQRYLTRDTARELLHHAPCAVWFMPARAA